MSARSRNHRLLSPPVTLLAGIHGDTPTRAGAGRRGTFRGLDPRFPETAMPVTSIQTSVLERFLRYVSYDTQSQESSETYPSTLKQLVLLDLLANELRELGLEDVERDPHGHVFGTIPATTKKTDVPVVGFIAHVDTSPEAPGVNVKPIVHRNWQGGDIVLPDDPSVVLRVADI